MSAKPLTVPTARGPAEIVLDSPAEPVSLLVLGHGAGGGVNAPDLAAVRDAVLARGVAVALVTQPYRVAGRRSPPPAPHLDEAWSAVVTWLRDADGPAADLVGVPLVVGGRSSGARVACRTARTLGAAGIVALAFPLHPPGRPESSRADELRTGLPTLVVNGDRDPFGIPKGRGRVRVEVVPGDHSLRRGSPVAAAVVDWLAGQGWAVG